jgi:hypothetical protein
MFRKEVHVGWKGPLPLLPWLKGCADAAANGAANEAAEIAAPLLSRSRRFMVIIRFSWREMGVQLGRSFSNGRSRGKAA